MLPPPRQPLTELLLMMEVRLQLQTYITDPVMVGPIPQLGITYFPPVIQGSFSIDLLNLMPGTQFYYRYLAFNSAAQSGVWSDQTRNFTTTASLVPVVGGSVGDLSTDGTVFDVELKSDLVYIGTGTVSNGQSASLTKIHSRDGTLVGCQQIRHRFQRAGFQSLSW